MYRFLLSRQWVTLTVVSLLLMPLFVVAGNWQYDRHQQRVERNELISGNLSSEPVEMSTLAGVEQPPDPDDRYRAVTATGSYDPAGEVVVRNRTAPSGGQQGYHVLTPLVPSDGGPVVLVNRGWIPAGAPTELPDVPAPPPGEVTVTGRLMADETSDTTGIRERDGLPEGMVMMISAAERADALDTAVLVGHLELAETTGGAAGDEAEAPRLLPAPDHTGIGAHFAYALQWWFFTAMVPVGWTILLRREARDRQRAARSGPHSAGRATATDSGDDPDGGSGAPESAGGDPRSTNAAEPARPSGGAAVRTGS